MITIAHWRHRGRCSKNGGNDLIQLYENHLHTLSNSPTWWIQKRVTIMILWFYYHSHLFPRSSSRHFFSTFLRAIFSRMSIVLLNFNPETTTAMVDVWLPVPGYIATKPLTPLEWIFAVISEDEWLPEVSTLFEFDHQRFPPFSSSAHEVLAPIYELATESRMRYLIPNVKFTSHRAHLDIIVYTFTNYK